MLVHGGGGTAFEPWVRLWLQRGYAAIAFDACGAIPLHVGDPGHWLRHDAAGPAGWGGWTQVDEPLADQWVYHAVADGLLAHSVLASLPEVDADRIGITGISWGGFLTCIIAGIDPRLKFAAPVYGCGFTNENGFAPDLANLGEQGSEKWFGWWDPSKYLPTAKLPMLWVNGTNDHFYTMNAWQKSYRLPAGPHTLCLRPRMPHAHGGPGENPPEILAFADGIVRGGAPLPEVMDHGRSGSSVWAKFTHLPPGTKATLEYTKANGPWQDRLWEATTAEIDADGVARAGLPNGVRLYYINVTDPRGCVTSAEHEELPAAE